PPTVVYSTSTLPSPTLFRTTRRSSPPPDNVGRRDQHISRWNRSCLLEDGLSRRFRRRTRPERGAVGPEPPCRAVVSEPDPPPVLMDELVVEGADEHEVVEIRRAAAPPPGDVVRLREALGPAARARAPD